MPLVVEDGTRVAGANSYVSLADTNAFFLARGLTIPSEGQLLQAMDTLNALKFLGDRASTVQTLSWPRTGVSNIEGVEYTGTEIPSAVVQAQMWLGFYVASGNSLTTVPSSASGEGELKRKKIGPLEKEWFQTTTGGSTSLSLSDLHNAWVLLKPLVDGSGFSSGSGYGRLMHA